MTVAKAPASAYYSLDEDARYILPGRIGFGSIVGAPLKKFHRTSGSLRAAADRCGAIEYQSSGRKDRSASRRRDVACFEGSLEARIKVTDTIGVVPFVDAGRAFDRVCPDFDDGSGSRPASACATTRRSGRSASTSRLPSTADGRQAGRDLHQPGQAF